MTISAKRKVCKSGRVWNDLRGDGNRQGLRGGALTNIGSKDVGATRAVINRGWRPSAYNTVRRCVCLYRSSSAPGKVCYSGKVWNDLRGDGNRQGLRGGALTNIGSK